jgi:hypothetical protein
MEDKNKILLKLAVMSANFQQKKERLNIFISEEVKLVNTHHKL